MLNLDQMNQIIGAALTTLETKLAPGKEFGIANPEVIKTSGAYGSVILCALFTGGVEGRLTWTMDWGTGFAVAEILTGKKVDGFNEATQQALEGLFHEFLQAVANSLSESGLQLDIRVLPTLVDTSVLLSEDGNPGAIKIPVNIENGSVTLFLALEAGTAQPVPAAQPDLTAQMAAMEMAPQEAAPVEDPSAALAADPSAALDPNSVVDPSAALDPNSVVDPSAALDPNSVVDPSAALDPSAVADPSAALDPNTPTGDPNGNSGDPGAQAA